jgi:hypothetical protein
MNLLGIGRVADAVVHLPRARPLDDGLGRDLSARLGQSSSAGAGHGVGRDIVCDGDDRSGQGDAGELRRDEGDGRGEAGDAGGADDGGEAERVASHYDYLCVCVILSRLFFFFGFLKRDSGASVYVCVCCMCSAISDCDGIK